MNPYIIILVLLLVIILSGLRIILEFENAVLFRLGRFVSVKKPGIIWIIPIIDKLIKVRMSTILNKFTMNKEGSKDGIAISISVQYFYNVLDAKKALTEVNDYHFDLAGLVKISIRENLKKHDLKFILSNQERINRDIFSNVATACPPLGLELKDLEIQKILRI